MNRREDTESSIECDRQVLVCEQGFKGRVEMFFSNKRRGSKGVELLPGMDQRVWFSDP